MRALALLLVVLLGGTASLIGLRLVRSHLAGDVYRARLTSLAGDYETLHARYEEALRRTAVTELRVEDGRLSVVVRTADGRLREIPTPYDPRREIYVDFAVVDGRLWIRRIFAEDTPPREGIAIDPALAEIDWEDPGTAFGKAAYRTLGEGRWVVSVTGDGSLGLAPAPGDAVVALAPPPPVRKLEPVASRVDERLAAIGPEELAGLLLDALLRPDAPTD